MTLRADILLRYLQTLTEIGAEQNSTVVFPMPIDLVKPFLEILEEPGKAAGANGIDPAAPLLTKSVPMTV